MFEYCAPRMSTFSLYWPTMTLSCPPLILASWSTPNWMVSQGYLGVRPQGGLGLSAPTLGSALTQRMSLAPIVPSPRLPAASAGPSGPYRSAAAADCDAAHAAL